MSDEKKDVVLHTPALEGDVVDATQPVILLIGGAGMTGTSLGVLLELLEGGALRPGRHRVEVVDVRVPLPPIDVHDVVVEQMQMVRPSDIRRFEDSIRTPDPMQPDLPRPKRLAKGPNLSKREMRQRRLREASIHSEGQVKDAAARLRRAERELERERAR